MLARLHVLALIVWAVPGVALAQTPIRLREPFSAGYQYHVSTRTTLTGELRLPAEAGKAPETVAQSGTSAVEYDERILDGGTADKPATKTLRIYRRYDLTRKVGDVPQEATIRTGVRRMVVLRHGHREVPFSPDGPLTWEELDNVRTDVFAPALAALLPDRPVSPGERWVAGLAAVEELTDLEKIEAGGLECRFDEIATLAGRKVALIRLSGTVKGVSEDGPTRHKIEGKFYFDLSSSYVSYLWLEGVQTLLDKDGKEAGQVRGEFTMTRQAYVQPPELADSAIRPLALEPNADNTLLYYDNPDLGLRLLHPRRWRVGLITGRQVAIDDVGNSRNGILLTLDSLAGLPTPDAYAKEAEKFITKVKGKVLKADPTRRLANPPAELEQFGFEAEIDSQRVRLEYYIARQPAGGATLAVRLTSTDLAVLERDVERIARSVRVEAKR
ncbi:MAG: hypothetical protein U0746_07375 [Gemmataceae bacterium]